MELTQFGKYTLLDHMGKGGVASVYRASSNEDGSIVAVKVFQPSPERSAEMSRKLRDREVRMLVSVQHPNIVKFREAGQVGDDLYYAMEFVENSLLKRMRGADDLSLVDRVLILRQTASALAAIHHKGIVHRDIKPGNILLDQDPTGAIHVKLTDLGIAKNVSETDVVREQMPTRVPGTLKYLSPEQIRLQPVDGRSDVFALGVVAYELIAGAAPFRAETTEEYLAANCEQRQMPVHKLKGDVPASLGEMVERMLAKDREERYDSDTLSRDLELVQQHLISGAVLAERTNPLSMFYMPPTEEKEAAGARRRVAVGPVSWALAFAIALLGVILSVALWPSAGSDALRPHAGAEPSPLGPAERLSLATSAAEAGRYWQALMLLRGLHEGELPAGERPRLEALLGRVQDALGEALYSSAAAVLGAGRGDEAEILLAQMQEFVPGAQRTWDLSAALRRERTSATADAQWQEALRDTYALVRRGQYSEALEARRRVLGEALGNPDRENTARRTIGDLLDHWARHLTDSQASVEAMEDFLRRAAECRNLAPGKPDHAVAGRLRLKLAGLYRDQGQEDAALAQYELAVAEGDAQAAKEAQQARDELRSRAADRPVDASSFARELERDGFAAAVWRQQGDPGTGQQLSDGTLELTARAGAAEALVYRETTRPVRNLGFTATVQFRLGPDSVARPGASHAGLSVHGTTGAVFAFAFDGQAYRVTVGRKSGQASAGTLRGALGDEAASWHTMGLSYDFNTGQVAALLDGQELRRYYLDLSDCRLRVFLSASPGASAGASFKDVSYRERGV